MQHNIFKPLTLLLVLIILGAVFYGFKNNPFPSVKFPLFTQLFPPNHPYPTSGSSPNPSTIPIVGPLGSSVFSFTDSGGETYLKHTINLNNDKISIPDLEERTWTRIYAQDGKEFESQVVKDMDASKFSWTDLVEEDVKDASDLRKVYISDNLFSYKRIPNSNSFLFVTNWRRSTYPNSESPSTHYSERALYFYDRGSGLGKLHKIAAFPEDGKSYTYPKIDTFSPDGRYVTLSLFGCWGCESHQPQTLLLDTQTSRTKNIGKVVQFAWGQNGAYQYKDYIVIKCPDELGIEECSRDPNTLPLKTGQF